MCEPTTLLAISLAVSVASAGASMVQAGQAANAQVAFADMQAEQYEIQAEQARTEASQVSRSIQSEFASVESANTVAMAVSGMLSGSFDASRARGREAMEADVRHTLDGADNRALSLGTEGASVSSRARAEGKLAKRTAAINAITSVASAAMSAETTSRAWTGKSFFMA